MILKFNFEENEYKQPPPFPRAMHFAAAPGQPVAEKKYPRQVWACVF